MMMPRSLIRLILFCLLLAPSSHAELKCSHLFSEIFWEVPHLDLLEALQNRQFRQGAFQFHNRFYHEATIQRLNLEVPIVVLKRNHLKPGIKSRLSYILGLRKEVEFDKVIQDQTLFFEIPGATTVSEIPQIPGAFVVGRDNGTILILSYNILKPMVQTRPDGLLELRDSFNSKNRVASANDVFGNLPFFFREQKINALYEAYLPASFSESSAIGKFYQLSRHRYSEGIASIIVTKRGRAWVKSLSGEVYSLDITGPLDWWVPSVL